MFGKSCNEQQHSRAFVKCPRMVNNIKYTEKCGTNFVNGKFCGNGEQTLDGL